VANKPKAEKLEPKTKDSKPKSQGAKLIVATGLVAILISFGGFYALAQNRNSSNGPIQKNCGDAVCVSVYDEYADPDVLTITAGSYVQFNAADGQKHNLSIGGDSDHHAEADQFSSGDFEGDEAWRVQFKQDGAYSFRDKYNPKVKINVVIYTEGKDYKLSR